MGLPAETANIQAEVSSMNSVRPRQRPHAAIPSRQPADLMRLYTVCVFDEDLVVPWVELLDARDDQEAVALARSIQPSKRREIWDRHRLVAELPQR